MSVAEYEYECSRAELLGEQRPSWSEFIATHQSVEVPEKDEADDPAEVDASEVQELGAQGEGIKRSGGGLDELNAILASTQQKINKFKSVCGSFTNLIKLRSWKQEVNSGEPVAPDGVSSGSPAIPQGSGCTAKGDVAAEVVSQTDRLDSMIQKAERAEISMSSQTKQDST